MDPELIIQALGWYVAFLVSVTLHEASHAFVALKLGDATAYHGGQVTLDPIPHIRREPFGMLIVPFLSFVFGGWMFGWGSAPYDPQWALNNPKKSAWMALAGPGANLLLVVLTGILIRIGLAAGFFAAPESISFTSVVLALDDERLTGLAAFVSIMFSLNLILFCFNLLPVPPLDGSALPLMFLQHAGARRYMEILHGNPQFSLIGIVIAWNVFRFVFSPIHLFGLNILYIGVARYG
jgi:Zn-dependent protease